MIKLAISAGDPAGIGGEVSLAAAREFLDARGDVELHFFGDPQVLSAQGDIPSRVILHPIDCPVMPVLGQPDARNGAYVIQTIEHAVAAILSGDLDGLVTAPIAKAVLYEAGFQFPGHTEFLGHLAGGVPTHMMLASDELRVVPVTLHQSLKSAIADLDEAKIVEAVVAAHAALQIQFGIAAPRLVLCGLNPHAGEGGTMGREDEDLVRPAAEKLRAQGIDIRGPLPADTLFHPTARETYDCALGLYHDQVLIPIKALAFDTAVNVTLGLPFVRTSPDHGTAFDIAGKGIARPDSFLSALHLAAKLAA